MDIDRKLLSTEDLRLLQAEEMDALCTSLGRVKGEEANFPYLKHGEIWNLDAKHKKEWWDRTAIAKLADAKAARIAEKEEAANKPVESIVPKRAQKAKQANETHEIGCRVCGGPIPKKVGLGRGRPSAYCGDDCRNNKPVVAAVKAANKPQVSSNLCKKCNKVIPPSGKRGRPAAFHEACRP